MLHTDCSLRWTVAVHLPFSVLVATLIGADALLSSIVGATGAADHARHVARVAAEQSQANHEDGKAWALRSLYHRPMLAPTGSQGNRCRAIWRFFAAETPSDNQFFAQ
jgi:hypothetical protein